jgi:hypothetical protein
VVIRRGGRTEWRWVRTLQSHAPISWQLFVVKDGIIGPSGTWKKLDESVRNFFNNLDFLAIYFDK